MKEKRAEELHSHHDGSSQPTHEALVNNAQQQHLPFPS